MKLEQRLRNRLRMEGKTKDTADCYWRWIVKFLEFAKAKRGVWVDPKDMERHQVEVFLTLATASVCGLGFVHWIRV